MHHSRTPFTTTPPNPISPYPRVPIQEQLCLRRQPFRHVDHVQFESGGMLNEFINGWRKSGAQRVGYLLGRYEHYDHVPLGITAVVTAKPTPRWFTHGAQCATAFSDADT